MYYKGKEVATKSADIRARRPEPSPPATDITFDAIYTTALA